MDRQEFSPPPAEFSGPPLEFAPLPDEFMQRTEPETGTEKKDRKAKWLYAAAALSIVFLIARGAPAGQIPAVPESNGPPVIENEPEPPVEEPPVEEPPVEEPPAEEPRPTWPLSDGTIVVTVYNNQFDMNNGGDPEFPYMSILLHETYDEAAWTDLELPAAVSIEDGWTFAGYVLHYNADYDYGHDSGSAAEPFVQVIEDGILNREDIELVPPDSTGTRYVNVHVMWLPEQSEEPRMRLELDDGAGNVRVVEGNQPFASEGYTYLATFGTPEREGYAFTGWYDADGNKVDYISYYDYFPMLPGGETDEDRDWQNPVPIRLTAGWKPS